MADISAIKLPDEVTYDLKDKKRGSVFFGQVENTSTSTAFTAQIDGITEYWLRQQQKPPYSTPIILCCLFMILQGLRVAAGFYIVGIILMIIPLVTK